MRKILGIAIELFEYNKSWQTSVLFLTFFVISTLSIHLMKKPDIQATGADTNKALDIISEQIGLSDEQKEIAESLIEKAKSKYQNLKQKSPDTEVKILSTVDQEPPDQQNKEMISKPTTLDTLNEI